MNFINKDNNNYICPKKSLGQNFLLDDNVAEQIVSSNIYDNATVLEIGAGTGCLTQAILNHKLIKKVIAVELDSRCIKFLQKLRDSYEERLEIINTNALNLQLKQLGLKEKIHIIANLPYNIATKLIMNWFAEIEHFSSITVMIQKEVAERFVATADGGNYGRISVIAQAFAKIQKLFDVMPESFYPQPKVVSSVISIIPLKNPIITFGNKGKLEEVLAQAFSKRRKMVRKNLMPLFGPQIDTILTRANIDLKARAEDISIDQFCYLATLL